jgi:hypothetical protein
MMSDAEIDKFFDSLKGWLKQFVDERIDEKMEPIRDLLLDEVTPGPQVGPLADALAVAELMGYDLSTPEKKDAARQKIYYLARTGAVPSLRVGKRRLKFDLEKVRQKLAAGAVPPPPSGSSVEVTSNLRH